MGARAIYFLKMTVFSSSVCVVEYFQHVAVLYYVIIFLTAVEKFGSLSGLSMFYENFAKMLVCRVLADRYRIT